MGVAVGREHLEDALGDIQNRDIKGATAQVEDGDLLVLLLLEPVRQGRGRRLVDDPGDLQAGDLSGVLGGLPLAVVEIGRDRDHRLAYLVAEITFRGLLQLPQDESRNLRGRVILVVDAHLDEVARAADDLVGHHLLLAANLFVPAAHEPLDRINGSPGIGDRLPLGWLANQNLSLGSERDHRRREPASFLVGNDRHIRTFHHRDHAVGRTQVDPDEFFTFRHDQSPFPR